VHLLLVLSRTMTLAKAVEEIKTGSSKWIKTKGDVFRSFSWQAGYAAFSVSPSDKESVRHYILDQASHHGKLSFQDELRGLLAEAGMEFDERYLWD
jgi:putative transposase